MKTVAAVFIENIKFLFSSQKTLGDKTFAQLSEVEMHFTSYPDTNSIAIIIQHIAGNIEIKIH
ncbi:hypothetical protein D3C87_1657000 [compost metagenome]|uniref:DUF1572 family protein n=1 Tax=Solitalea canadensis TaxID=995 RepID=UPI0002473822|nr:DUF1572 family protein [Solitalea canadensis]